VKETSQEPQSLLDVVKGSKKQEIPELQSHTPVEASPSFNMTPKEYYSGTAVAPPIQGMGLGMRSPELSAYMWRKFGIGPPPEGGVDELGRAVDAEGNVYGESSGVSESTVGKIVQDTLKGFTSIVSRPDQAAQAIYNVIAGLPGFMTGMVAGAAKAGDKLIGQIAYEDKKIADATARNIDVMHGVTDDTSDMSVTPRLNLDQVADAFAEGMTEAHKFYAPAMEKLTSAPTRESQLAEEVAMASFNVPIEMGKKVAAWEGFKDYPNVRGAAKIAGAGTGALLTAFLLHGSSRRTEFVKKNNEIVKEADAIVVKEANLSVEPNTFVKTIQEK